jgi:hypothetical protein
MRSRSAFTAIFSACGCLPFEPNCFSAWARSEWSLVSAPAAVGVVDGFRSR